MAVIADEAAFWHSEESSNPDTEILAAVRPGLATTGGLLAIISSPYARRGEVWETLRRHYGPAGDPLIPVAQGASRTFNPTLPQSVVDRALRDGRLREYLRHPSRCKNWALRGTKRCRLHGGLSTGPTSPEGLARTIAAMREGRRRWLANLKSEGKPVPFGRKKGGRNAPLAERVHTAHLKKCQAEWRAVDHKIRSDRKERREEARLNAAEHARRKARADAGLPYWTEEEWENM